MSKSRKSSKVKRGARRSTLASSRNNPITPIKLKPIQQRVVRYELGGASTAAVTRGDLLNWVVSTTGSSTAAVALCEAVKLNRVKVIGYGISTSNSASVCLEWNGDRSPSSCTSVVAANAVPAVINQTPPSDSLARYWSIRGSDEAEVLFTVTESSGTIIDVFVDIHFDYVIGDGLTEALTLSAAASATGIALLDLPNDTGTALVAVDLTSYTLA